MVDRPPPRFAAFRRGTGQPLLVLGGGPGLSHDYLPPALAPLEAIRQLHYLDFPGCGAARALAPAPRAEDVASATRAAIDSAGDGVPVDILCHSFGAYALTAALRLDPQLKVGRVVFTCPSPHSRAQCRCAEEQLFARMTPADRQFAQEVFVNAAHRPDELMRRLLPYYCGRAESLPALAIDFNARAYVSVIASLAEFDHNDIVARIPRKFYIFGETDFIRPTYFQTPDAADGVVLKGGHFIFFDAAEEFLGHVRAFLR
jgi:pimeloyl-ACP methyl ester carboxylesterase